RALPPRRGCLPTRPPSLHADGGPRPHRPARPRSARSGHGQALTTGANRRLRVTARALPLPRGGEGAGGVRAKRTFRPAPASGRPEGRMRLRRIPPLILAGAAAAFVLLASCADR